MTETEHMLIPLGTIFQNSLLKTQIVFVSLDNPSVVLCEKSYFYPNEHFQMFFFF